MQVPTSAQVTPTTVTVNNSATVVRGFSTEVRSDVPPIQQGEGVRYTRGRPSDNDTYNALYSPRKRGASADSGVPALASQDGPVQEKDVLNADTDPLAAARNPDEGVNESSQQSSSQQRSSQQSSSPQNSSEEESGPFSLSPKDEALVEQLQKRDREVRLHEMAHQTAGGQFTGGASYEYRRGPDGKNYAVGGEVSVDVSAANSPEDTIQKARQIKAAALAPAQPSAQDRQVAREAEQMIVDARQELRVQAQAEAKAARLARENAEEKESQKESQEDTGSTSVRKLEDMPNAKVDVRPPAQAERKVTAESSEDKSSSDSDKADKKLDKSEKPTAREALEKILLAGQSLTAQAGAAGYMRPDAPAGDSGLLNVVI